MTIENINIDETLKNAAKLIAEDKDLSPATKSLLEILVLIISVWPESQFFEITASKLKRLVE